ncbi:ATP-binding cassette sub-family B member 10, mitochondrial-like isoform X2 [Haliotis cracherodii]|uniref:ATP-binding cassette sub-family B member 10, mitochondrial-like isoform X2 n=1 Tax=Haliotis cracherodii TaxID=6455 RepID=UPI0039EAB904
MNSIRILGGITLRPSSLWKVVVQYRTVKTSPIWRQKVPKVPNSSKTAVPKISDVKRLIGLAKPERLKLAGALGLLVVSSGVTMAVPFCIGKVIDIIYTASQEGKMEEKLNSLCQILLVVFLLGGVANFGRVYLMTVAGQNIVKRLREKLFNSVMKQEIGFFDKTKTGELINRLSADASLVGQSVTNNISDGLRSIAQAVGGVGMMVYVSAKLTAISLGIVPPVALVSIIYGRYVRNITKQVQTSLADATQLAEEKVGNIRTVRAFAQEEKECAAYDRKISHVLKLSYKEALARGVFWGFTGMSGNVIVLSVFYYGGLMMTESQMTVGELSAFLLYAAYVGVSMGGLTTFYTELMRGLGASSRLWQLVDREPRIPVAGSVQLDGQDIRELNPTWLRNQIGTVSQEPVLFSCSIAENIGYGASNPTAVTDDQIITAAKQANAYNFIQSFPEGFQTLVGERGHMLSGGQRQRVAIARAILKDPKILLLDEATSALDAESEYLVQEALERLMVGRTVITIAHRLSTIKTANQIAVINDGCIVEAGSYDELMLLTDGMFRRLVERQTITR